MRRSIRFAGLALLLGFVALTGCRATGGPVERSEMQVAFELTNAAGGPSLMTVWLVPDVGESELLGSVGSGETEVFRYGPAGPGQGRYRLIGQEPGGGATIVSNAFHLTGDAVVRWDTGTEIVTVKTLTAPAMP